VDKHDDTRLTFAAVLGEEGFGDVITTRYGVTAGKLIKEAMENNKEIGFIIADEKTTMSSENNAIFADEVKKQYGAIPVFVSDGNLDLYTLIDQLTDEESTSSPVISETAESRKIPSFDQGDQLETREGSGVANIEGGQETLDRIGQRLDDAAQREPLKVDGDDLPIARSMGLIASRAMVAGLSRVKKREEESVTDGKASSPVTGDVVMADDFAEQLAVDIHSNGEPFSDAVLTKIENAIEHPDQIVYRAGRSLIFTLAEDEYMRVGDRVIELILHLIKVE